MSKIFEKIKLKKMDEMERAISLKAQRNAYVYVVVALFVWSMLESISSLNYRTALNLTPCFLLCTTSLVQSFSRLYFQKKAVKGDEEYKEANPMWKVISICFLAAAAITAVGSALTFWILAR